MPFAYRRMEPGAKVYVAGHTGLVGSALVRALEHRGYGELVVRESRRLDLRDQAQTAAFFAEERPEFVILAAARVGGILANKSFPAEFIRDNLLIACNVIDAAWRHGVQRLLFLGSSCVYPRLCVQPMKEEHLLGGPLEPTNEAYALAKIAGVKLCDAYNAQYGTRYLTLMPTNLYGPHDNFDTQQGHVVPGLIQRFHKAKAQGAGSVTVWGSGKPRRELMYVDDVADACLFVMEQTDQVAHMNVGLGADLPIGDLAKQIAEIVGFRGAIHFDASKPDGSPRKLLDVSRLSGLGWKAKTSLRDGLERTYAWFVAQGAPGTQ